MEKLKYGNYQTEDIGIYRLITPPKNLEKWLEDVL
jgi:hypothetical protein